MYKDCLTCPKLGISCDGANFLAMTAHELLDWCKLRKNRMGLSNADLAEMAGVPVGTLNRLFSSDMIDCKYETVRPIVKALVGDWTKSPCPTPGDAKQDEHLIAELERLKAENESIKRHFTEAEDRHNKIMQQHYEDIAKVRENTQNALVLFKSQMRAKNIAIIVLSAVVLLFIFAALGLYVYDKLSPGIGWLR